MYRLLVLAGAGDVTGPQANPPGRRDEAVLTGASGAYPSGSTTEPAGQPDMAEIAAVGNS
jgi:hypothetical protein